MLTIYRAIHDTLTGNEEANEANEANYEADEANNEANEVNRVYNKKHLYEIIIEQIQMNLKISKQSLTEMMGVSRSTIQRYMAQLEKSGRIQRVGGTRGNWNVLGKS